jgi:uncharacterized protein YbbK (DUF523 family)
LLGELVRYDGREKRAPWVQEHLAREVELVSLCPEVGAGMSIPRPPIQVVKPDQRAMKVVRVRDGLDVSAELRAFAERTLATLADEGVDGYVFKARSPSCGLVDTPHFEYHGKDAPVAALGAGLWADAVTSRFPDLPVVDEAALQEEDARGRFVEAVFEHFERRRQGRA